VAIVLAVVAALLAVGPLRAQEPAAIAGDTSSVSARHLRTVLLLSGAYGVGGMAVMERVWYRDRDRVPFHSGAGAKLAPWGARVLDLLLRRTGGAAWISYPTCPGT
jgi:hypothetical protein